MNSFKITHKTRILSLTLIAIILSILSYSTFATIARNQVVAEEIVFAEFDFEVEEKDEKGNELSGSEIKIIPGDVIKSTFRIKNTSSIEQYVKVRKNVLIDGYPADDNLIKFVVGEGWLYKDGYYTYSKPLKPYEYTDSLFKEIMISPYIGNELIGKSIKLDFDVECLQCFEEGIEERWIRQ